MDSENKNVEIVKFIQQYPILLDKSQVPTKKNLKKTALEKLVEHLKGSVDLGQAKKKIQNMKTEVKNIADRKKTGNKKIVLEDWQKDFLKLLNMEENPTVICIPGELDTLALY